VCRVLLERCPETALTGKSAAIDHFLDRECGGTQVELGSIDPGEDDILMRCIASLLLESSDEVIGAEANSFCKGFQRERLLYMFVDVGQQFINFMAVGLLCFMRGGEKVPSASWSGTCSPEVPLPLRSRGTGCRFFAGCDGVNTPLAQL